MPPTTFPLYLTSQIEDPSTSVRLNTYGFLHLGAMALVINRFLFFLLSALSFLFINSMDKFLLLRKLSPLLPRVLPVGKKKGTRRSATPRPCVPLVPEGFPILHIGQHPLGIPFFFFFLNPLSGVGTQPCGKIPQRNPRSPPKASVGFPQRPLVHAGPRQTPSQSTFGQRPGGAAPPRPLAGIFRA